jgi:hypothetical protein
LHGLLIRLDDRLSGKDVTLIAEFIDANELGLALEQIADVLRSGPPSRSGERGSLCGTTTIGGGESHSHDSWLGTPDRGRAPFDLSSIAATGCSHIPEGPSCTSSTLLQLRAG